MLLPTASNTVILVLNQCCLIVYVDVDVIDTNARIDRDVVGCVSTGICCHDRHGDICSICIRMCNVHRSLGGNYNAKYNTRI
jgi:hypothetical protein